MTSAHPFDVALSWVDRDTRRITAADVDALTGSDELKVTTFAVGNDPVAVIDLCLRRAEHGRVSVTAAAGYRGPSIGLLVTDMADDGTMTRSSLGIEPCLCPVNPGDSPLWNPLALTLLWHPGLPNKVRPVVMALRSNIADMPRRYCRDGIATMLAQITSARN